MTRFLLVGLTVVLGLVPVDSAAQQAESIIFEKEVSGVVLKVVARVGSSENHRARITSPGNGTIEIDLQTRDNRFSDAFLWQQSRLILFGEFVPTSVMVLDLPTAALVDSFLALRPSVSPSGRYIAFTKHVGRTQEAVESGSVYLLYDVSKSPYENRMVPDSQDADSHVGTAVFPSWNRDSRSYSGTPASQGGGNWRKSPLVWANDEWLVFLHQLNNSIQAVTVSSSTPTLVRTLSLDVTDLVEIPSDPIGTLLAISRIFASDVVPLQVGNGSCKARFVLTKGLKLQMIEVEW
jgi:hypothetical protein